MRNRLEVLSGAGFDKAGNEERAIPQVRLSGERRLAAVGGRRMVHPPIPTRS